MTDEIKTDEIKTVTMTIGRMLRRADQLEDQAKSLKAAAHEAEKPIMHLTDVSRSRLSVVLYTSHNDIGATCYSLTHPDYLATDDADHDR